MQLGKLLAKETSVDLSAEWVEISAESYPWRINAKKIVESCLLLTTP
jgi:hypothetical protein